uniref:Uncharacterized protein n=1 Tax=Opuntia streptacantha TaxID=393608 RepID=A0A7C9AF61_OPUST
MQPYRSSQTYKGIKKETLSSNLHRSKFRMGRFSAQTFKSRQNWRCNAVQRSKGAEYDGFSAASSSRLKGRISQQQNCAETCSAGIGSPVSENLGPLCWSSVRT